MAVHKVNAPNTFTSAHVQEVLWCHQDGTIGSPLRPPTTAKKMKYIVNGGNIKVNGGIGGDGPVATFDRNSTFRGDVNFIAGEESLYGRWPSGDNMPDFTAVVIEFDNAVRGVGAEVTILRPSIAAIPNGTLIAAIMRVDISDNFFSNTGHVGDIAFRAQKQPPFIGVETDDPNEKIGKIWFDASRFGNWNDMVISRLYWWA
jgi:hypothetical protein